MGSTDEIAAKWQAIRTSGLDLGSATEPERGAGFGGRVQVYEHGHIYWHPQVGTCEVHGAILTEYLRLGGPGERPGTGGRAFGFPRSDEHRSPDGVARISEFEWGAIHWGYGAGAVALYGPIYAEWGPEYQLSSIAEGWPLTEPVALAGGGEAAFFTDGLSFTAGPDGPVHTGYYIGGTLGKPSIADAHTRDVATFSLATPPDEWQALCAQRPGLLDEIFGGRLVLARTGSSAAPLPLVVVQPGQPAPATGGEGGAGPVVRDHRGEAGLHAPPPHTTPTRAATVHDHRGQPPGGPGRVTLTVSLAPGAQMEDRALYDVSVVRPDGKVRAIGVHAVYCRHTWNRFGVAHVTDIHVAQRADDLYRKLRELGRDVSADAYNNPNDAFRDFIRCVNQLHDRGQIDVILATGDLIDYQHEGEDLPPNGMGGNFLLFERIVRGMSASPLGTPVEELRVPMFTTLGNHDYRAYPYGLLFEVDVPVFENPVFRNYDGFNMTVADVGAMQGLKRPWLTSDDAAKQVALHTPRHYFARINGTATDDGPLHLQNDALGTVSISGSSYVVRLGPKHRLVVLDSRYDIGIVDDFVEAFEVKVAGGNEDMHSFAAGAPNQVGVTDLHLGLLSQALGEAGAEGVVITGIHGPPINIKGNEFAPYFRETEHASADKRDVMAYLIRQDPYNFKDEAQRTLAPDSVQARVKAESLHHDWVASLGKPYFMTGGVGDQLDREVSKGRMDDFLKLCTGTAISGLPAARPVDVVLCGHGHNRVEYRLEWDAAGKRMRYFMDFYTENPGTYYRTKKALVDDPVHVVVKAGAPPNGQPTNRRRDEQWEGEELTLEVPPYADPLRRAADKDQWWARHRPLIVETGALGPVGPGANDRPEPDKQKPGPNFQGFRVLSVVGSTIADIRYVRIDQARDPRFRLPWTGVERPHGVTAAGAAGPRGPGREQS